LAPGIKRVQVLGLEPERMVRILPGRIHDLATIDAERVALMYTLPMTSCYSGLDPMSCFGLNTSGIQMYAAPTEGADVAWAGPTWMTTGPQGAYLHPVEWTLSEHLLVFVNMSSLQKPGIFIDVAVDLSTTAAAARMAAPAEGSLMLLSSEGFVLASSAREEVQWVEYDGSYQRPYVRFWDSPLAVAVTPDMLATPERLQVWVGRDLAIIRPLELGMRGDGMRASSTAKLRALALVPRNTAMRPLTVQLCYAAVGVLVSPFVAVVLLLIGYALLLACRRAKQKCWDDP